MQKQYSADNAEAVLTQLGRQTLLVIISTLSAPARSFLIQAPQMIESPFEA